MNTQSTSQAASPHQIHAETFILFPKLTIELRQMIWQHAFPASRVIQIHTSEMRPCRHKELKKSNQETTPPWSTLDPVPAILHACQESRREALRFYQPIFPYPLICTGIACSHAQEQRKLYINYSKDIMLLDYNVSICHPHPVNILDQIPPKQVSKIQHLALELQPFSRSPPRREAQAQGIAEMCTKLRTLTGLRSLIITLANRYCEKNRIDLLAPHQPLDSYNHRFRHTIELFKQNIIASKASDDVKNWILERITIQVAYESGFVCRRWANEVFVKLPYHPWYRHPELMEVADDYMLKIIENRLKKVTSWSAEEEKEWSGGYNNTLQARRDYRDKMRRM